MKKRTRKSTKDFRNKVVRTKEGVIYADMHTHTVYSDGLNTLDTVKRIIAERGIHIAVTDHNAIKGSLLLSKTKKYRDKIIPGIEVGTKEKFHALFYFYDFKSMNAFYEKEIKKFRNRDPGLATKRTVRDLLDVKEKYNAISCIPHPYSPFSGGIMKKVKRGVVEHSILDEFDWVEAINSIQTVHENIQSKRLATHLRKPHTAGSDSHDVQTLGKALTYGKADDLESFYKMMFKQKNQIAGVHLSNIRKAVMGAKLASVHVKHLGPFLGYYAKDTMSELDYYGHFIEHVMQKKLKRVERRVFKR